MSAGGKNIERRAIAYAAVRSTRARLRRNLATVFAPMAIADVLRHRLLVYVFPTINSVGAAGIRQSLARTLALLARIVWQQHVTRCQKGGVLIEDVHREFPAQRHEAGHLSPCGIRDEERIGADVERRRGAEFTAPHLDGAHVLKVLVQHVRDHAEHVGQLAVGDFVLEVDDDNGCEIFAHDSSCLAPIRRNRAGCSSWSIIRPAKVFSIRSLSGCVGHFGFGNASWSRATSIL